MGNYDFQIKNGLVFAKKKETGFTGREYLLFESGFKKQDGKCFPSLEVLGRQNRPCFSLVEVYEGECGKYPLEEWKPVEGALTAPNGFIWISNGKSIFDPEYKTALLKIKEAI